MRGEVWGCEEVWEECMGRVGKCPHFPPHAYSYTSPHFPHTFSCSPHTPIPTLTRISRGHLSLHPSHFPTPPSIFLPTHLPPHLSLNFPLLPPHPNTLPHAFPSTPFRTSLLTPPTHQHTSLHLSSHFPTSPLTFSKYGKVTVFIQL